MVNWDVGKGEGLAAITFNEDMGVIMMLEIGVLFNESSYDNPLIASTPENSREEKN